MYMNVHLQLFILLFGFISKSKQIVLIKETKEPSMVQLEVHIKINSLID